MGRISRHAMFMEMARAASKRSTCSRLNVGAIITCDNRPVSVGWGGTAPGAAHCAGNDCPGMKPGGCPTIHAEVNAINHIPVGLDGFRLALYTTHSPCRDCMMAIINSLKIADVYYEVPYRNTDHLVGFLNCGIYLRQVMPAGYIRDHFTGRILETI